MSSFVIFIQNTDFASKKICFIGKPVSLTLQFGQRTGGKPSKSLGSTRNLNNTG